jgi:hypothetical protein
MPSTIEAAIAQRRADAARILRGVAELFSTPGTWTQGAWARDAKGDRLARALDETAVCWCLLGAVKRVRGPGMSPAEDQAQAALRRALRMSKGETLAGWNDSPSRTVDDVRRLTIQAAEMLEARL